MSETEKRENKQPFRTVADHVLWSYANLARADAALQDGVAAYNAKHHMIRQRLFKGLTNGTMAIRSLYDDERVKMTAPHACCYCGETTHLTIDHLIPRLLGGPDDSDNLVLACRSCNSSKQGRDVLAWMATKGTFPAVLLLRRYLKLVIRYCEAHDLLQVSMSDIATHKTPFDLMLLPHQFPPLGEMTLWVSPKTP